MVVNMFQHVQADTGIRAPTRQVRKCHSVRFANERMQIRPIGIPLAQPLDTRRFQIDGQDRFTIEQHAGEIADAAAHLYHPLSQVGHNQPALPGKVVGGLRHAFLICYGVDRRMHCLLF